MMEAELNSPLKLRETKNKLAKLGDAIAISNLKLSPTDSLTDSPTDRGRCKEMLSQLKIQEIKNQTTPNK